MRFRYSYLIISVVFALGLFGALLVQLDGAIHFHPLFSQTPR